MRSQNRQRKKQNSAEVFFSIVIPCYNSMPHLRSTLNSVLEQSFTNFEVILINDGSTDDTLSYINCIKDSRLQVISIANSGGPAKPRNLGIQKAKGIWISFLDSDDIWYKNKLSTIFEVLKQKKDVEMVTNAELLVNKITNKNRVLNYGTKTSDSYSELLIWGNKFSPSATFIKLSVLKQNNILFDERSCLSTVEDYDFWLKLCKVRVNAYNIEKVLGEYLIHGENSISNIERHFNNLDLMLNEHIDFHEPKIENRLKKIIRARVLLAKLAAYQMFGGRYFHKIHVLMNLFILPISVIRILIYRHKFK